MDDKELSTSGRAQWRRGWNTMGCRAAFPPFVTLDGQDGVCADPNPPKKKRGQRRLKIDKNKLRNLGPLPIINVIVHA